MPKMLIANRLTDGRVVFRAGADNWVESIAAGQLIDDDTAAARCLEAALTEEQENLVIDPCLIDVTEAGGKRCPDVYREAIRTNGPSVDAGP